MFLIPSEDALLQAFRPRDRKVLEPPPGVTYPLFVRDYRAAGPLGACPPTRHGLPAQA